MTALNPKRFLAVAGTVENTDAITGGTGLTRTQDGVGWFRNLRLYKRGGLPG
jgi:hypothetical protein